LDIRPKCIFNKVSQEFGFICPEYSTIKSQVIISINKQLNPKTITFTEISDESEFYEIKSFSNKKKKMETFLIK